MFVKVGHSIDWFQASCAGRMGNKNFLFLVVILFLIEKALEYVVFTPLVMIFGFLGKIAVITLFLLFLFATAHVFVRRLHDMGCPGWWYLIWLAVGLFFNSTLLLSFMLLLMVLIPGKPQDSENEYGPPESEGRPLRDVFFYGHG